jgi:glucose/arabinose dehydrogenase
MTTTKCWLAMAAALLLAAGPAAAALYGDRVVDGLAQPVRVTAPPRDGRLFVVELGGVIRVFDRGGGDRGVFLDITPQVGTGGERGLLGLAFDPDYNRTGRFYINFTDTAGDTRIARFLVDPDDPDRALPGSGIVLLTIDQPFANHNGGHLEFGPDGMLYIGMGDGGGSGDPDNRAQNDQLLLGKMLRIDVSGPDGYTVPADNPFVGGAPRDEIWATGLRNPWCFGFDRVTGDLWIADVGQNAIEEIDRQPAASAGGENYGWRLMEGSQCFNPPGGCDDGSLTLPLYEYAQGGSPYRCSISGGYVYRGLLAPELYGQYLFSDFCSNEVLALVLGGDGQVVREDDLTAQIAPARGFDGVVGICQDAYGELYVIELGGGAIWRIISDATAAGDVPAPARLEQNYPNPFNPATTIAFTLPAAGHALLTVHDLRGRRVATLLDADLPAGPHTATWRPAAPPPPPAPQGRADPWRPWS